jgi:hypothetical protein
VTIEFLAVLVAAFSGAGIGMILRWLSRRRLPRWIVPALAASAMLGTAIFNEYNWFPRLRAGVPAGVVIAEAPASRAPWRPWSYVWPLVEEAWLVDQRQSRRHPEVGHLVITEVWRFARWQGSRQMLVAFDCQAARRVEVREGVRFTDDGTLEGGEWVSVPADDPVLRAACDGG